MEPGVACVVKICGRCTTLTRESEAAAIVRYIAHGALPGGERYLAMEWLEGEDLAQRFSQRKLSPEESLTLLRRIFAA